MIRSKSYNIALFIVAGSTVTLLLLGMRMLTIPKIFMLAQGPYSYLPYEGPGLVVAAVLLAWFRESAVRSLLWLFHELHRWLTALLAAVVMGAEGFMHVLGIPHIEGWWIPMLGSGAFVTAISLCLQKLRKNP